MINLEHLISHRFRGFSERENTLDGLKSALDFGVLLLEFDIRVTRCGTPVIYHDEYALDAGGKKHIIANTMLEDFPQLGGTFTYIPTADALFSAVSRHKNSKSRLLVDIKDAGFEQAIHALICGCKLQDRIIYVSWLPNALYALHDLSPKIPLCLSHWCQKPNIAIRLAHKVHKSLNGHIPRLDRHYIHGERSGWFVKGPLRGELRQILINTNGAVCVPENMITRELVDDYHADGILVSTFGYTDWKTIKNHKSKFNIDQYFIDNKKVFEDL